MTTLLATIAEQNVAPVPGVDDDVEPDLKWKEELRSRIERELQSSVDKVRQERDASLRGLREGTREYDAAMRAYRISMDHVRRIAEDQFSQELKIARFERSLAQGKTVEGEEFEMFRRQQQAIWDKIKQDGAERPQGRPDSSVVGGPTLENGDPVAVPPRASGEHDAREGPSVPYRDSRTTARAPPAVEQRPRDRAHSGGSDTALGGVPGSYGSRPSRSRGNSSVLAADFELPSPGPSPYEQSSIGRQGISSLSRTRPQEVWLPRDNSPATSRAFAHATAPGISPISPSGREGPVNDAGGRTLSRAGSIRSNERPSPITDLEPGSSLPRDRFGMGSAEERMYSRKGKEPDRSEPPPSQPATIYDYYVASRRPESRTAMPITPARPSLPTQSSDDQYFYQASPAPGRPRADSDDREGIPVRKRSSRRSLPSDQGSPENPRYMAPNSASARPIPSKRSSNGDYDPWQPGPSPSSRPIYGPQSPPAQFPTSNSRPIPRPTSSDDGPRRHSPSGPWYGSQSPPDAFPFAGYEVPFSSSPRHRYATSSSVGSAGGGSGGGGGGGNGNGHGRRNSNGSRSVRSRSSRQEFWGPADISQRPLATYEEQSVASDTDSEDDYGVDLDDLWRTRERHELQMFVEQEEARRRAAAETKRLQEEAQRKEEEARKKEEEARRQAEEARRKEEEVRLRALEIQQKEEELRRREAELAKREMEAKLAEERRRREELEAMLEEERRKRREAEEEAVRREQEEARRRAREEAERRELEEAEKRRQEREEVERLRREREDAERQEREKRERERRESEEKERRARELQVRREREREEREKREREEQMKREREEQARQERLEQVRLAREEQAKLEREEQERKRLEKAERDQRRREEALKAKELREQEESRQRQLAAEAEARREADRQAQRVAAERLEAERQQKEAAMAAEAEAHVQSQIEARARAEALAQAEARAQAEAQRQAEARAEAERVEAVRVEAESRARAEEAARQREAEAASRTVDDASQSPPDLEDELQNPELIRQQELILQQIQAQNRAKEEAVRRSEDSRRRMAEEEAARARRVAEEQAQQEGLRREREARRRAEEEHQRKLEENRKREEALMASVLRQSEEEHRRYEEQRKRQDSVGSAGGYSSASSSAPRPVPTQGSIYGGGPAGDRSSTASSSSYSSSASFFSAASGRSTSTGYSTSSAGRSTATPIPSGTPTPTAPPSAASTPAKGAWKSSSFSQPGTSPTTPSRSNTGSTYRTAYGGGTAPHAPSTPSHGRPPPSQGTPIPSEEEWARRQEEHARKQFEQFQRDQAAQQRRQEAKAMKQLSKEEVIKLFEDHERRWARLPSMDVLSWHSFPWPMLRPPSDPEQLTFPEVQAYILSPHQLGDKTPKDRIKDYLRKWHPDRFETKLLPKVREEERETVKEGAGAVARHLNKLLSNLSGSAENGLFG